MPVPLRLPPCPSYWRHSPEGPTASLAVAGSVPSEYSRDTDGSSTCSQPSPAQLLPRRPTEPGLTQLQQTGPLCSSHTMPGAAGQALFLGSLCLGCPSPGWWLLPQPGPHYNPIEGTRFPPGPPSAVSIIGRSQSLINLFIYYVSLARLEVPQASC